MCRCLFLKILFKTTDYDDCNDSDEFDKSEDPARA